MLAHEIYQLDNADNVDNVSDRCWTALYNVDSVNEKTTTK